MYVKPDPLGIPRNPFAVFLLGLSLVSGLITLFGVPASNSMEQALPLLVVRIWGGMLAFGSGITLVGMYWQKAVSTGLLMKRIGMLALMVATTVYSATLLITFRLHGLFPASIIAFFGVAAYVQYRAINRRVQAIIHETRRDSS